MTACTNHGGKARRVVTAALVGVLSVGTVPMVALAEGVSDAVSPMFAEPGAEFSDGEARPTFTVDSNNDGSFGNSDGDVIPGQENAEGVWGVTTEDLPMVVSVDQLTVPGATEPMEINASNIHDYKIRVYAADEKGEPTGGALAGNKVTAIGEYVVTVTALDGDYEGQTFKTSFYVKGQALPDNIEAYENGTLEDDDKFIYTGSPIDLGFKWTDGDGEEHALVEGVDYSVVFKDAAGREVEPTNVGTYSAYLTGLGVYEGTNKTITGIKVLTFTLDDPDVHIEVADFVGEGPSHPTRVWYDADGFLTELDPSLVGLVPTTDIDDSGKDYIFDVTVDQSLVNSGNIALRNPGTASNGVITLPAAEQVTARKVDHLATFQYNGQEVGDVVEIDASAGYGFNRGNVYGFVGTTNVGKATFVSAQRVEEAPGVRYHATNAAVDLNAGRAGLYKVTYSIPDGMIGSESYSGYKSFYVKIYKGTVDVDKSLYVYAPEDALSATPVAITSYAKSYDGEVLEAASFGLGVKGVEFEDGDIDVAILDAEGNEVDSAVDAGTYKFVVTSDWYKLSGTTELPITIGKVDLTSLEVGEIVKWNDVAGEEYLPLKWQYVDTDGDGKSDSWRVGSYPVNFVNSAINNLGLVHSTGVEGADYGEAGYDPYDYKGQDALPDNVEVAVEINDGGTWKEVGAINEAGQYRLTVTVAEAAKSNYVLPEGATSVTIDFTVAAKGDFSDVQPSDWYYDAVSKAFRNQYMKGYPGTTTFGAEDNLTRAQAVIVLFNMSGATFDAETDSSYDETKGWVTGFSDVDGNAYYAEAVAWAKSNGVVNGNDGKFMPEDEITREQFAAMLSNYAKVVNRDETVDSADQSVLADFADANTVSEWAKGAVAWAASATEDRDPIMGNNGSLMGQNKITRGEVAAMVTNYQPNAKPGTINPGTTI